ncbi:Sulfotransferase [Methylophaga thiooxydans]|uniref:Sulfotransferase n=1 Tax=Methylophaga thiooxydans TaxID=392484 RepID=A0A0A0BDC7_9GAMM|nr:sulfotransferase [Methylophaga thiooxydans]KGM06563.1 Sulfotransferase [Methylophaga thiooxydans]
MRKKLLTRFARTRWGKKVLARTGRSLDDKQWVFILGCYNSGTTLLQRLMQVHPDIAVMPAEGVAFTDVVVRPEEYGWTRMWWKCVNNLREDSDYSEAGARRLRSQWSRLTDKPLAPYILEKSIVNVVHAPFYVNYFNQPKFIHLIRNGYAVSEGIRRKAVPSRWNNEVYTDKYPISLGARQWVETLEAVDNLKQSGVQVLEVHYEDLAAEPDAMLAKIFKFLDLADHPVKVKELDWKVHGTKSKVKDMNSKSIQGLSQKDLDEVTLIAGEWLKKFGYK